MAFDRTPSITHQQLRVFVAVAREGSFVRAAHRLLMSEPTVSIHVRTLERAVGTVLIERSRGRRDLVLTSAGQALLQTCDTMFRALEEGLDVVRAAGESIRRTITIGAGPHSGGFILPPLVDKFTAKHPTIDVRIEVDRNQALLDDLKRGRLDIAVLFAPIEDEAVACAPFLSADVGLIGPAGHRLAEQSAIPFTRLVAETLVVPEASSPQRRAIEKLAQIHGLKLRVAMESQDLYARIKAVQRGLGIAPMYLDAISAELTSGQVVILDVEGFPQRVDHLIATPRGVLKPPVDAFRRFLLQRRTMHYSTDVIANRPPRRASTSSSTR